MDDNVSKLIVQFIRFDQHIDLLAAQGIPSTISSAFDAPVFNAPVFNAPGSIAAGLSPFRRHLG